MPFLRQLQELTLLRDAVVAGAAVLYLAGYLAWSLYAWTYRLGPIQALRAQYFVAGVPVVAVLAAVAGAAFAVGRLAFDWWPRKIDALSGRSRTLVLILLLTLILTCTGYGVYSATAANPVAIRFLRHAVVVVAVIILPFALVMIAPRRHPLSQRFMAGTLYIYLGAFGVGAVGRFIIYDYSFIPQEFGGAAPRRAQVDLRVDALSAEIRRDLFQGTPLGNVARSRKLWVLARTEDSIIVTLAYPNIDADFFSPRLEISSSAVVAVVWEEWEDTLPRQSP